MKIHAQEIFKRNVELVMVISMSVLCLLMVIMNWKAISSSKKPLIIGIDSNGARVVTENSDPIFKTEASSFIQRFTFNIYNFTSENFMKRIGLATTMMGEDLWKKKRSEILDLKTKVERDEITVSGKLSKLTIDGTGTYHGLIEVKEKSRLNVQDHKIEATIKLKTIQRTQENPSGLEVESYEETTLRN